MHLTWTKYKFCETFYEIGLLAFTLTLSLHEKNIHKLKEIFNPLCFVQGSYKGTDISTLEAQHRLFQISYILYTYIYNYYGF